MKNLTKYLTWKLLIIFEVLQMEFSGKSAILPETFIVVPGIYIYIPIEHMLLIFSARF